MPDIASVIRSLHEDGSVDRVANSPRLAFLDGNDQILVGAQLLPEVVQPVNRYDEEDFTLVDMIADDTERYSPVKFKGEAAIVAAFEVVLGESSLGKQLSPKTYDALLRYLQEGSTPSMAQMAQSILDFVGSITRGLSARNELQRWQAIVDGSVTRVVGGTAQEIAYPSATRQRTAAANDWSDDTYDPFEDLAAQADFASDMGYGNITRIITSRKNLSILSNNKAMRERSGRYVEGPGGTNYAGRASQGAMNTYLVGEGLPAIETYDLRYTELAPGGRTRQRYLQEDAMVFVFDTGQVNEEALILAEEDGRDYVPVDAPGSLGYTGVGTISGHTAPGKTVYLGGDFETVRPRVHGEGAQTSLPVLQQVNGFSVVTGIA